MRPAPRVRASEWVAPGLLILLSMVPALAGAMRLAQLSGGAGVTPENARFFAQPLPVVLHILGAIPFGIFGALQFAKPLRRYRGWHRAMGKVLFGCGMVVALTGLWMAHFYPWPAADGTALYLMRLVFGTAMAVALVLAVDAVARRRDFAAHGAWVTRAWAIGMGAGTQVLTHLPWFMLADGKPTELPRAVMMGAGWVINIVVAEWVIRRRATAAAPAPAIAALVQASSIAV